MSARRPGHRVLIVEDNPEEAEDLRALVESRGDSARVARTVEEALIALEEERFCLLLVDQELPAKLGAMAMLGGGECIVTTARAMDERLRGRFHVTPILVVTSKNHEDFISKMYDLGASGFMSKPIRGNFERLLDKTRVALERAGRAEHACCPALAEEASTVASPPLPPSPSPSASPSAPPPPIVATRETRLAVDGVRRGKRIGVLVDDRRCELQEQRFLFFLKLVAAYVRERGAWVELVDLGGDPNMPSRVRTAFVGFVPEGFLVVERNNVGGFRLNPLVVLERVDWVGLQGLGDEAIARVAKEAARGR